jgi:hypothetical protein
MERLKERMAESCIILALCVLMFLLGMAYERVTTVAVLYHPPPSETITDNFSIEIGQEMDIPKY